ncbi:uncharacterized protein LOC112553403 [Pomacea canaliculata]|uniref:uncharacterized protein LOC112553403 n=1 Tax=Pomacea canaliculata TaxID=400727 RepID=UPI000D72827E|nr:uncharacterized protein LOC112553403 [Pomacea canaliculata]
MKWFILCFVVVALAQRGRIDELLQQLRELLDRMPGTGTGTGTVNGTNVTDSGSIDTYHGWRIEDHHAGTQHLLLFIKDQPVTAKLCYLIIVSHSWDHLLEEQASINKITEEIYAIIRNPSHSQIEIPPQELADTYQDFEGAQDCRGHQTYQIYYSPSFLTTAAP